MLQAPKIVEGRIAMKAITELYLKAPIAISACGLINSDNPRILWALPSKELSEKIREFLSRDDISTEELQNNLTGLESTNLAKKNDWQKTIDEIQKMQTFIQESFHKLGQYYQELAITGTWKKLYWEGDENGYLFAHIEGANYLAIKLVYKDIHPLARATVVNIIPNYIETLRKCFEKQPEFWSLI